MDTGADRPRGPGRGLALGVVGALLVVLAVALFVTRGTPSGGAQPAPAPPLGPEEAAPGADEATDVARALESLPANPDRLVAAGAAEEFADRVDQAVPPGSVIDADPSSWHPDGMGGGVMKVRFTVPDRPAVDHLAVVVQEDGAWKVLATLAVRDISAEAPAEAEGQ